MKRKLIENDHVVYYSRFEQPKEKVVILTVVKLRKYPHAITKQSLDADVVMGCFFRLKVGIPNTSKHLFQLGKLIVAPQTGSDLPVLSRRPTKCATRREERLIG